MDDVHKHAGRVAGDEVTLAKTVSHDVAQQRKPGIGEPGAGIARRGPPLQSSAATLAPGGGSAPARSDGRAAGSDDDQNAKSSSLVNCARRYLLAKTKVLADSGNKTLNFKYQGMHIEIHGAEYSQLPQTL